MNTGWLDAYSAASQPVLLRFYKNVGARLLVQGLQSTADGTQITLPLPAATSMHLLQVRAGKRTATTRLVK